MGSLSPLHWVLVLMVVLLLFGTGRISNVMGDFAKGIKAFKKNMADDSDVSMEASEIHPPGTLSGPGSIPTAGRPTAQTAAHVEPAPVNRV
jgi:sec-independent protein translocase protein TatA